MSGLKIVPQGALAITRMEAPSASYEPPVFEDAFTIDYEEGEDDNLPRSARQFVRRMQRREAKLRAKGRIL